MAKKNVVIAGTSEPMKPAFVELWYDRSARHWVMQVKTAEGYEIKCEMGCGAGSMENFAATYALSHGLPFVKTKMESPATGPHDPRAVVFSGAY